MSKEARERNFQPARDFLTACRAGEITNNGYNLWLHTSIYARNGGRWNRLDTTRKEVNSFLVQDLQTWIQELREDQVHTVGYVNNNYLNLKLMILDAYFLGDKPTNRISHKKLGITPEEMNKFKSDLDISFPHN